MTEIFVTKTFVPRREIYASYLDKVWETGWMTNGGELKRELQEKLVEYLKVPQLALTANGTLALQVAIKSAGLTGEVITTPFSYIATSSSIVWENLTPVFVDIHPKYLTINESLIEDAITEKTSAILATHVFGNPCAIETIEAIARQYNLKVIYDASHCFDVAIQWEIHFQVWRYQHL